MTSQSVMTDLQDADFADRLKGAEPKRCMFDLEGRCNNDPVDGHFIQEGLLKLIQDSTKRVVSFYNLQPTDWRELGVAYALNRPISPHEAAKCRFLCEDHEKFFWLVESPGPNWNDPEHKARLTYRACLANHYIKEWFIKFASDFWYMAQVVDTLTQQLSHATPLESATREYLNGTDSSELRHTVARIQGRPRIAASGVILHPPLGTYYYDSLNRRVTPVPSSPIVINILPAKGEQIAMFSYTRDGVMDGKNLMDTLEYGEGSIGTARLSKKLLEEVEFIHVSPKAWATLGRPKQELIRRYWEDSFGAKEWQFNLSPSRVDLFATRS